jgi:acyl-[acyl-carrier-protein] desaturase
MSSCEVDFDLIECHLARLLERHSRARQRVGWDYAELIEELSQRRLEGILVRLGDGLLHAKDLRAAWADGAGPIAPAHAKALETAYLGEANLPWYAENLRAHLATGHHLLDQFFHRWVSEEDQHGRAFEIYLLMDRTIPGTDLLAAKAEMLRTGRPAPADEPFSIMVYTSIQELSTRVFYAKLTEALGDSDPILTALLRKVQTDEALHLAFYRDSVRLCLERNPNLVGRLFTVLRTYHEPVTVLPDYQDRKQQIWQAGVSSREGFKRDVITPLLRYWNVERIPATSQQQ